MSSLTGVNAESFILSASKRTLDSCVAEISSRVPDFVKSIIQSENSRRHNVFYDNSLLFFSFQSVYWRSAPNASLSFPNTVTETASPTEGLHNNYPPVSGLGRYLVLGFVNGIQIWKLSSSMVMSNETTDHSNKSITPQTIVNHTNCHSIAHSPIHPRSHPSVPPALCIIGFRTTFPVSLIQLLDDIPTSHEMSLNHSNYCKMAVVFHRRIQPPEPHFTVDIFTEFKHDEPVNIGDNTIPFLEQTPRRSIHVLQLPWPINSLAGSLCWASNKWVSTLVVATSMQIRVYDCADFHIRFTLCNFLTLQMTPFWGWLASKERQEFTMASPLLSQYSTSHHLSEESLFGSTDMQGGTYPESPIFALGTRWLVYQQCCEEDNVIHSTNCSPDTHNYQIKHRDSMSDSLYTNQLINPQSPTNPELTDSSHCLNGISNWTSQHIHKYFLSKSQQPPQLINLKLTSAAAAAAAFKRFYDRPQCVSFLNKIQNVPRQFDLLSQKQQCLQRFIKPLSKDNHVNAHTFNKTFPNKYPPLSETSSPLSHQTQEKNQEYHNTYNVFNNNQQLPKGGRIVIVDIITGDELGVVELQDIVASTHKSFVAVIEDNHLKETYPTDYISCEATDGQWCLSHIEQETNKTVVDSLSLKSTETQSFQQHSSNSVLPAISLFKFDFTGTTLFCADWTGRFIWVCRLYPLYNNHHHHYTISHNSKKKYAFPMTSSHSYMNQDILLQQPTYSQCHIHTTPIHGKAVILLHRGKTIASIIDIASSRNLKGDICVVVTTSRGSSHCFSLPSSFHLSQIPNKELDYDNHQHIHSPILYSLMYPHILTNQQTIKNKFNTVSYPHDVDTMPLYPTESYVKKHKLKSYNHHLFSNPPLSSSLFHSNNIEKIQPLTELHTPTMSYYQTIPDPLHLINVNYSYKGHHIRYGDSSSFFLPTYTPISRLCNRHSGYLHKKKYINSKIAFFSSPFLSTTNNETHVLQHSLLEPSQLVYLPFLIVSSGGSLQLCHAQYSIPKLTTPHRPIISTHSTINNTILNNPIKNNVLLEPLSLEHTHHKRHMCDSTILEKETTHSQEYHLQQQHGCMCPYSSIGSKNDQRSIPLKCNSSPITPSKYLSFPFLNTTVNKNSNVLDTTHPISSFIDLFFPFKLSNLKQQELHLLMPGMIPQDVSEHIKQQYEINSNCEVIPHNIPTSFELIGLGRVIQMSIRELLNYYTIHHETHEYHSTTTQSSTYGSTTQDRIQPHIFWSRYCEPLTSLPTRIQYCLHFVSFKTIENTFIPTQTDIISQITQSPSIFTNKTSCQSVIPPVVIKFNHLARSGNSLISLNLSHIQTFTDSNHFLSPSLLSPRKLNDVITSITHYSDPKDIIYNEMPNITQRLSQFRRDIDTAMNTSLMRSNEPISNTNYSVTPDHNNNHFSWQDMNNTCDVDDYVRYQY